MKSDKSATEIEFVFDLALQQPGPAAPPDRETAPPEVGDLPDGRPEDTAAVSVADSDLVNEEEAGGAEDAAVEEAGDVEEEMEDPHGEALAGIRDELAAASTENRRNTRRIFDALKQFGGVLDALSAAVNDIHSTTRAQAQAPARPADNLPDLIELADRVDRIAAAFAREPAPAISWWPPTRRAIEAWRADRERLADSFGILSTHVRALLKNAGLERISCEGELFDPSCMHADEAVIDTFVDDHTVLAEILPGWRETAGGRVVRPAHVRVSRAR